MVKFFSICLVVLLLCSCHSRRKEIARIVEEWKNKEVIFPDPLLVKVQGRDTILPDFQERKYKILNYIDTSGCTECRMKLAEWQLLKQEIDSLGYDVDILFVAWVHNYDELDCRPHYKDVAKRSCLFRNEKSKHYRSCPV